MSISTPPEDRLLNTIADVLDVAAAELSDDSSPDTVDGWDSVSHLNLVMSLEQEFNVSLSPQDALDMRNVLLARTILRERGVEV